MGNRKRQHHTKAASGNSYITLKNRTGQYLMLETDMFDVSMNPIFAYNNNKVIFIKKN